MEFTDDIHILVNGAIDKPEVSLLLFFSLRCLFLERNLTLCLVSLSSGSDYHKYMEQWKTELERPQKIHQ